MPAVNQGRLASHNFDETSLAFIRTGEALIAQITDPVSQRSKLWERIPPSSTLPPRGNVDPTSGFLLDDRDSAPRDFMTGIIQLSRGLPNASTV